MLDPTVSPRPSVVALAASLVFLAACQREEAAPAPPPVPAVSAPPVVAIGPAPVLDRTGLLQAMDVAASAYAAGKDPGGATLVGRPFVIRQAFGCAGPAPAGRSTVGAPGGDGLAAWSWGDKGK